MTADPQREDRAGRWPLLPIAPVVVAAVGIAVAVIIASVGARQLQRTSDEAAALRSKALAATLAARIRAAPVEQRAGLLARSARRTSAYFLLVDQQGSVLSGQMLASLSHPEVMRLLSEAEGTTNITSGRVRFAASSVSPPLENLSVMAFVPAPYPAAGTIAMSNAVAALTLLLLGVAVAVALVFTKAARDDVTYVRQRIADMARGGIDATSGVGTSGVPLRSLDQVGLLTAALNVLIERFAAAERSYRSDLTAAARLDAERSQFLAGLSHELRTPLNAILGFTHLLEGEDDGPLNAEQKEALAMIASSGEHLKSLIGDILDLSAMETGQLRLTRQLVDVGTIVQEVAREARATMTNRAVQLVVDGAASAMAWADPRRLRQMLTNLVSNAIKATSQGTVRVHLSHEDAMVVVAVSDTGVGIEPGALQTIFEPYKQAGDVNTRQGGVGLGLAITRRLVLLHGGSIRADSTPGVGSIFTLSVPDDTHSALMPRDSLVPWADTSARPTPVSSVRTLPSARRRLPGAAGDDGGSS